MNKEQVKAQLRELQEKQQDFVIRIDEARTLLAELMLLSETYFVAQQRDLIHKLTNSCEHNPEHEYTRDGVVFCGDCGESLRFTDQIELAPAEDLPKEPTPPLARILRESVIPEAPFNFDLENMKRAVESPVVHMPDDIQTIEQLYDWLLNCTVESEDPPKKMNYCPHNDCGWCYANKDTVTNAINSGCFKPQECPANSGD